MGSVLRQVGDFLASAPGKAATALAQGVSAIGSALYAAIPGLRSATEAASGLSTSDGHSLSSGQRVTALGAAALEFGVGGSSMDVAAGRAALGRLMGGEFSVMAGSGTSKAFRAAGHLGGNAADWAYVTSRDVVEIGGSRYQAHWAQNVVTGETAMAKLKLLP